MKSNFQYRRLSYIISVCDLNPLKTKDFTGPRVSSASRPLSLTPRASATNSKNKIKFNVKSVLSKYSSRSLSSLLLSSLSRQAFNCSKLIIKTLEECVNPFQVNNKDTRAKSLTLVCFLYW